MARMILRTAMLVVLCNVTCVTVQAATPRKAAATETGHSYRWTDNKGVIHYGDSVPPEFAQGTVTELDGSGNVLRELGAQPSAVDQAAEAQRTVVGARDRQRDHFLLTTYTSIHDIEDLRDERLAQLETQINAGKGYVEAVATRLDGLKTRLRNFHPYSSNPNARRLPDTLAAELVQTLNEVQTQSASLLTRQTEQQALRDSFQADINRFRELMVQQGRR
jgi:hypothetical protein